MYVSGFTFIRNAILYDYPIMEAITSILPVCDEVVVAVGRSEDTTLDLIRGIDPGKVRIVETVWNDALREGGRVLAEETDKAFRAISPAADWAFYIQGDEVVHEQDLPRIKAAMQRYKEVPAVDGLLFDYLHFYGSYDHVGASSQWYGREVRVVRNDPRIHSYRDAQGFRKEGNRKLDVVPIGARMHHYGWVKEPTAMQRKVENFNKYWHSDAWVETHVVKAERFDYDRSVSELKRFTGTHPAVMQERIRAKNWQFAHDPSYSRRSWKERGKAFLRERLGWDVDYRNYRIVRVPGS